MHRELSLVWAALLLLTGGVSWGQGQGLGERDEAPPGINDRFIDPKLNVEEWVERFEGESREVFVGRKEVVEACDIRPGQVVADIGAGTGLFSRMFAASTGDRGWVYAVDISPKFLQHINQRGEALEIDNITTVLCSGRSVTLPPKSIDVAFICDTYHHFEHPESTLASLYRALRPGGSLVVIDFERIPGKSRPFILGHVRAGKEVFQAEIVAAGFRFTEELRIPAFKENYFLRFRKPSK